jgi:hypothetical protein
VKARLFVVLTNLALVAAAASPWLGGLGKKFTWTDGH